MFVSTRASESLFDCIRVQSYVTVTGNPGVGKTATMRYVGLKMRRNGYTVVPTNTPVDIRNFSKKGKRMLFVVDDVCGQYTVDPYRIGRWQEMSEVIHQLFENKYCKLISTCRLQIVNDVKFRSVPFLKYCECNLNSNELCLTSGERSNLALKYFKGKAGQVRAFSEEHFCVVYTKKRIMLISNLF